VTDQQCAVGIECTDRVLRAVLIDAGGALPARAAEVSLRSIDDDRVVLDAFVRLRAELGGASVPARIAMFPASSSLHRIDVTGQSGPELNASRSDVAQRLGMASTLLVDHGPRRWLYALNWPIERVRRFETLAERAGFLDVAVEPSPLALARAVSPGTRYVERAAAAGETFTAAFDGGVPVAAVASNTIGTEHPSLFGGGASFSVAMFDGLTDIESIIEQILAVYAAQPKLVSINDVDANAEPLLVGTEAYPVFPPHDLRSPARQCVAIGAAIGAARIGGRHRPVDIIQMMATEAQLARRPWAIERVSSVSTPTPPQAPGAVKRAFSRFRPRRG
jgi:hypothetical protein